VIEISRNFWNKNNKDCIFYY